MKNIVFICTGNTCRSPMAEYIFKYLAKERGMALDISSAATMAYPGEPMNDNARTALKRLRVPYDEHKSTPVSEFIIRRADLILTMEARHARQLLIDYPSAADKVFTLKGYANNAGAIDGTQDIRDPYGQPLDCYIKTAMEIEKAAKDVLERLQGQVSL